MEEPTIFQRRQPKAPQADFSSQIGNLSSRLKMLEERHSTLQHKAQITEQNMLQINKELRAEIKTLSSDISEMKVELNQIDDKLGKLVREVQHYARKEDVAVLKKYLDLWEPVNFVTQEQMEEAIRESVEQKEK